MYIRVLNHINMSQCTYNLQTCICRVCVADVQCTDGYIHFMKCTDIVELGTYTDVSFWLQLFYLPCRLACRLGLAAAWSLFNYYPVLPPFRQGWGQVQKQQAPRLWRGQQPLPRLRPARRRRRQARQLLQLRPCFAGVLVWRCSGILLVL